MTSSFMGEKVFAPCLIHRIPMIMQCLLWDDFGARNVTSIALGVSLRPLSDTVGRLMRKNISTQHIEISTIMLKLFGSDMIQMNFATWIFFRCFSAITHQKILRGVGHSIDQQSSSFHLSSANGQSCLSKLGGRWGDLLL